jgi:hypothetical protein
VTPALGSQHDRAAVALVAYPGAPSVRGRRSTAILAARADTVDRGDARVPGPPS